MIRIELTDAEAKTLQDVLDSYLSDLRMEIADTDSRDFRENLKARKKVLEDVIGRLQGGGA
jgi:LPS O-antigen subunit length determinant protein (WzzB/FepE family)